MAVSAISCQEHINKYFTDLNNMAKAHLGNGWSSEGYEITLRRGTRRSNFNIVAVKIIPVVLITVTLYS